MGDYDYVKALFVQIARLLTNSGPRMDNGRVILIQSRYLAGQVGQKVVQFTKQALKSRARSSGSLMVLLITNLVFSRDSEISPQPCFDFNAKPSYVATLQPCLEVWDWFL